MTLRFVLICVVSAVAVIGMYWLGRCTEGGDDVSER